MYDHLIYTVTYCMNSHGLSWQGTMMIIYTANSYLNTVQLLTLQYLLSIIVTYNLD